MKIEPNIDRIKAIRKWRPVLENIFIDFKYLLPYIEADIAYQLEFKIYNDPDSIDDGINKLPIFINNIKTYISELLY